MPSSLQSYGSVTVYDICSMTKPVCSGWKNYLKALLRQLLLPSYMGLLIAASCWPSFLDVLQGKPFKSLARLSSLLPETANVAVDADEFCGVGGIG